MTSARLTVVTGKGGVGRSTIAAALALRAARTGERVLAVDASGGSGLAPALGHRHPLRPGKMTMAPGVDGLTMLELDTEAALDEYVRIQFRSPIAPRSLGPVARIFEYVATAAPAVREILTIGKIGHEVRRGPWDLVVVDGPATGHIVELLAAPTALGELVGLGPLANETAWLSELLADPAITGVVVVTMAEELPVTETLDLLRRVDDEAEVTVTGLVVNRWPPPVSPAGIDESRRLASVGGPGALLAQAAVARARIAEAEVARLEALGRPLATVPDSDDPLEDAIVALEGSDW